MTKNLKITSKITATTEGRVAHVRIVDYIGEWEESSSRNFRNQVDSLIAENIDTADVYINSRGGNVFEATEIANELARFKNVNIRIGAIAASAATYITSKFRTVANPNSQLMIHRPSLNTYGDVNRIESDLKLLKNITKDYQAVYAAKTGKTETDIETLWANGDYWMTAQEALDNQFIDEIAGDPAEAITVEDVALLEACGAPVIPRINIKNSITNMERNKIIAALGLAADATDEQIEAKAAQLKLKAGSYDTLLASQKEENERKAKTLVADAVKAKKITEAESAQYEKQAIADYDFVAGILTKLGSTPKLSAQLNTHRDGADNAQADWTMQDYLDKDPEALSKLYEDEPEKAAELEASYFKN